MIPQLSLRIRDCSCDANCIWHAKNKSVMLAVYWPFYEVLLAVDSVFSVMHFLSCVILLFQSHLVPVARTTF